MMMMIMIMMMMMVNARPDVERPRLPAVAAAVGAAPRRVAGVPPQRHASGEAYHLHYCICLCIIHYIYVYYCILYTVCYILYTVYSIYCILYIIYSYTLLCSVAFCFIHTYYYIIVYYCISLLLLLSSSVVVVVYHHHPHSHRHRHRHCHCHCHYYDHHHHCLKSFPYLKHMRAEPDQAGHRLPEPQGVCMRYTISRVTRGVEQVLYIHHHHHYHHHRHHHHHHHLIINIIVILPRALSHNTDHMSHNIYRYIRIIRVYRIT